MTDREKLVELIQKTFDEQYAKRGLLTAYHTAEYLIENGVTVKEPQKPLTVEEVRAIPEIVWLECRSGDEVKPMIPSQIETNTVTGIEFFPLTDGLCVAMITYGRYWRCWAEKPTDEERKAAEWEK